jgi:hypothetical protein
MINKTSFFITFGLILAIVGYILYYQMAPIIEEYNQDTSWEFKHCTPTNTNCGQLE